MSISISGIFKPTLVSTALCLIFFLSCPVLLAQKRNIQFKHLTTQNGLSQSQVTSIIQDNRGFIWLGTRDGLNKYDGYKFTVYRNDPEITGSISGNFVQCMLKDRQGNMWVGTFDGGLNLYNPEKDIFAVVRHNSKNANSLSSDNVSCLLEDRSGNIWIGEDMGYIDMYNPQTKIIKHYRCSLSDLSMDGSVVSSLAEDKNGNIWAGTRGTGLHKFNSKTNDFGSHLIRRSNAQNITAKNVLQMYVDGRGKLWINGWGTGLIEYDVDKDLAISFYQAQSGNQNSLCHNDVLCLLDDHDGNLWIGTENGGVSVLNLKNRNFCTYRTSDGLSDNSIYSLFKDNSGNLWIGTNSGGVNFGSAVPPKFSFIKKDKANANSLTFDNVISVLQDRQDKVWIGTDGGGLDVWERDKNIFHHHLDNGGKNSVSSNYVISLFEDKHNVIWVGNFLRDIDMFNESGEHVGRLPIINAYTFAEDSEGFIWIGTWGQGIFKYDRFTRKIENYQMDISKPDGLNNSIIYCFFEDGENMWVGTAGGGLNLWNKRTKTAVHYVHNDSNPKSLSNNVVNRICRDNNGNLWIATNSGLNLFNPDKNDFTVLTVKNGLANDQIQNMLKDSRGNLWLSTNNGVTKFNPDKKTFRNYNQDDGLLNNSFRASFKGKGDEIFLGSLNGLNFFYPDSIKDNTFIPPVVITDFQIFNLPVKVRDKKSPLTKHISETNVITVSHKESVLGFEFAALNYTTPEKNRYSYFLEGFDLKWSPISGERRAIYTNLDPGEYIFHVKGANNDGVWNEKDTSIKLIVTPPFWMTWQFRTLSVLFVVGSLVSFYRVRIETVKKQRNLLEAEVQERTKQLVASMKEADRTRQEAEEANRTKSIFLATMSHEIRTPMNGVLGMASLLAETPLNREQQEFAKTIQSCGESLLGIINDILDYSKIESGKLELEQREFDIRQCIESVLELFAGKAAENNLDLLYRIEPGTPLQIIGDSLRLRQVLLNLVSNAIKFTTHGEIVITLRATAISQHEAALTFEVRDTGIGIPKDKLVRLFKAFSQVDASTTRKYGGTGLGLVISERLIELMNGSIDVQSEEGRGTTFIFSIKSEIPNKSFVTVNADVRFHDKRVLVVDDNAASTSAIQNQLEQWGLMVTTCTSAVHAKEILLQSQSFDLILTDMDMPEMNGIELIEQLKKSGSEIPVVLLTRIGDERAKKSFGLVSGIITKPIKYNNLLEVVTEQLTGKKIRNVQVASDESNVNVNFALQHPLKVLLVEDNPVNQKLALRLLAKLGYDADVAGNGKLAIDAVCKNDYDLILMDVQMPEMDGLEATGIIRKQLKRQPVIIAMTANAMQGDREVCLNAGMNDYISKPIKLPDVVTLIKKWAVSIGSMKIEK